jgi:hypothetical protein
VRHFFGFESFGVNVFVAREAGDRIVPEHTESADASAAHEELYFVVRGEVDFTVDGQTFDAPALTLIAVRDPQLLRAAVARNAGDTVLAVGGTPGRTYRVSRWDQKWTSALPQAESSSFA